MRRLHFALIVGLMLVLLLVPVQGLASEPTGGTVTTPIGAGDDHGYHLAIQPDGKIVVAADTYNGVNTDLAVVRYTSEGRLDSSFGTGGIVTTDFGGFEPLLPSQPVDIAIHDGKIIIVSSRWIRTGDGVWAIARYNPDGSLDTSFDGDGRVTTDFQEYTDTATAVVVQDDGKIVVAGEADNGSYRSVALARYLDNGSLDPAFGSGGKVIGSPIHTVRAALLQPDGKIVLVGYQGTTLGIIVTRYNSDGSLDSTFGTGGWVHLDLGREDHGQTAALQPDGKILVAGTDNQDVLVARFNSDGSVDTSFGTGGCSRVDLGGTDAAQAITLLPDGRFLIAGATSRGSGYDFLVARFLNTGALDQTFGVDGYVTAAFGGVSYAQGLGVQSDGKIVASGRGFNGTNYDVALMRVNSDGSPDTSFGCVNLAPIVDAGPDVTIDEGGTFTGSGSFADPDADTWTATVDYGDDSVVQPLALQPGSSGSWQETVLSTVDPYPWNPMYLMGMGDANNDGKTDITLGTEGNWVPVKMDLYQRSTSGWTRETIVDTGGIYNGIAGTVIADADGDGKNEVLYGLHRQSNVDGGPLLMQEWTGSAWNAVTVYGGIGDWSVPWAVVDAEGDGSSELIATIDTWGYGTSTFEPWVFRAYEGWSHESISSISRAGGGVIVAGDCDGDGLPEMLRLSSSGYQDYSLIEWSAGWQEAVVGSLPGNGLGVCMTTNSAGAASVGDLDGDGRPEFVFAYLRDNDNDGVSEALVDSVVIRVVGYDGGVWTSADVASFPKPGNSAPVALAVGDADNDGHDEIYAASEDGVVRCYSYAPGPYIESLVSSHYAVRWHAAKVGDVDDDGYQDLVLVGRNADGSQFALVAYTSRPESGKTFELSHLYADNGVYTVTVTVADDDGGVGADTLTVQARSIAPTATFTASPSSVDEGSSMALAFTAQFDPSPVDTAAGFAYSYDCDGNGTFEVVDDPAPSHVCMLPDNGTYMVRGRIEDKDGDGTTYAAQVVVANVCPLVGLITAPLDPVPVTMTVRATARFTDAGVLDTHTGAWSWGDGKTSAGIVTESLGSGVVGGTHVFTIPGVYTVQMTVTDKDGCAVAAPPFQYVVVYDTTGGFVTGGGWINSPAGAYTADPTLTGKTNLSFDAKYKRGATVPTGNVEFQFKAGNLNFHSSSYQWLVVSGARAQFKGEGTINGAGAYGFILTAVDGDVTGGGGVDKFRIKIWDKATGSIVYDNKMGASDDADPATALGGGSIVIHKEK